MIKTKISGTKVKATGLPLCLSHMVIESSVKAASNWFEAPKRVQNLIQKPSPAIERINAGAPAVINVAIAAPDNVVSPVSSGIK